MTSQIPTVWQRVSCLVVCPASISHRAVDLATTNGHFSTTTSVEVVNKTVRMELYWFRYDVITIVVIAKHSNFRLTSRKKYCTRCNQHLIAIGVIWWNRQHLLHINVDTRPLKKANHATLFLMLRCKQLDRNMGILPRNVPY